MHFHSRKSIENVVCKMAVILSMPQYVDKTKSPMTFICRCSLSWIQWTRLRLWLPSFTNLGFVSKNPALTNKLDFKTVFGSGLIKQGLKQNDSFSERRLKASRPFESFSCAGCRCLVKCIAWNHALETNGFHNYHLAALITKNFNLIKKYV